MNVLIKPLSMREAEKAIDAASSYAEWASAAVLHDSLTGMEAWKRAEVTDLYDYAAIKARLQRLRNCRLTGDNRGLLFTLNEGIHGNMAGMGNRALYSRAKIGTKQLITEYIDEIACSLRYLADLENSEITFEEKLDFFHRASHCFGRTALMLSGGAALGNFHLGVIKTLVAENLLPKVISGASVGAIFAAAIGTNSLAQLQEFFKVENLITASEEEAGLLRGLWSRGDNKLDRELLNDLVTNYIPDLTFEEAYKKTGRHINITVSPVEPLQKGRLLNAIASPNVLIRSAVMASTAVPGLFPPVALMAKDKDGSIKPYLPLRKWIDGSFSQDLPTQRLARLYGVNHYIVSLTNPFVVPFASDPARTSELRKAGQRLLKAGMREISGVLGRVNRGVFKSMPRVESLLSMFFAVLGQNYTGDINIIYRFHHKDPRRLMSLLTASEMMEIIHHGERATWPKVEVIRSTTKVGRLLDEIIDDFEQRELTLAQEGMRYRNSLKKDVNR